MTAVEPLVEAPGVPAELRQDRIADEVESSGFARVTDLADRFGVSVVTVRSDLGSLEAVGRVRRVRGGAVPVGALRHEPPLELAAREHEKQKAAIAAYAASLVQPGQVVILDVGSTTTAIALELVARRDLHDVTIVTNGLNVALALEPASDRISVLVTGGMVRQLQHSLVNPFGSLILEQISAHMAFIGCNGVDAARGVTNLNFAEAEVKRAMILAAREVVVVADGSKIGEVEAARVCSMSEVDLVVTDMSAPDEAISLIEQAGTTVHHA
ncbi:MAG: DeoR/GlpR transcriptional regulator [Actinobacteria bacterium]|nr:DeoR/GlpR transcriptional regulator [Actinomycetota bacterium]